MHSSCCVILQMILVWFHIFSIHSYWTHLSRSLLFELVGLIVARLIYYEKQKSVKIYRQNSKQPSMWFQFYQHFEIVTAITSYTIHFIQSLMWALFLSCRTYYNETWFCLQITTISTLFWFCNYFCVQINDISSIRVRCSYLLTNSSELHKPSVLEMKINGEMFYFDWLS